MKTIALLVTSDRFPSNPKTDPKGMAGHQADQLAAACLSFGIILKPVAWDAGDVTWSDYDAVCALLAWSYPRDFAGFVACLNAITEAGVPLVNGAATLLSNMDKAYLADLASKGAPVPPTLVVPHADKPTLDAAFEALNATEIVVKPRIGAGAWRQARIKSGAPLPSADELPPSDALIQPFIPSVEAEGELSLLYFGGEFSHALMKRPKPGDYRTQGHHGAREEPYTAPPEALAAAERVLALEPGGPFVYARVDLVADGQGSWLLMELELIEPYLYAPFDGSDGALTAERFALALDGFARGLRPS